MVDTLIKDADNAIPITIVKTPDFINWIEKQPKAVQRWTATTVLNGEPGSLRLLNDGNGELTQVIFCVPENPTLWDWAPIATELPVGTYTVDNSFSNGEVQDLIIAWGLAQYRFDKYKFDERGLPSLAVPKTADLMAAKRTIRFTNLARDLINTPASDMGPDNLADEATDLANEYGAGINIIVGDDLLTANYPAVHAIGRAHDRAPRLIDLTWGDKSAVKITLVGKGVCFDTGGLNMKTNAGMKLMRKDMGGGAHALALAGMIMDAKWPVRLRVLVPAVENSISGNAVRPGDIVMTRKGLSVEITNTDAEGRVILADALHEASSEQPRIIIDFATLTGAGRIALGSDMPALFCNDDKIAESILAASSTTNDPLWRMPLWQGYAKKIKSKFADLNNAPESSFGGAITAALFLEQFVGENIPWAHIDLMAWNLVSSPGRPEGGEAMGLRAIYSSLYQNINFSD
ncbi:MAG: leucyl aminopeptidase [Magnetovibrio sp.]|nr:leucyl aminopeptidase [Magnetovibrio sp.]|tara:strand:- start:1405 stop:2787 length:1383 start_codon:yes stop_codon:yes gene_type:complete